MIKANELRIGNLLKLSDEICVVNSVHEYGSVRLTPLNRHALDWKYESFNFEQTPQLQPIPLTEEILLKCGFVITADPENLHYKKVVNNEFNESFVVNRKVGYNVFYISHKDCNNNLCLTTQIKHIHQLQNLYFALTNKELKIEI